MKLLKNNIITSIAFVIICSLFAININAQDNNEQQTKAVTCTPGTWGTAPIEYCRDSSNYQINGVLTVTGDGTLSDATQPVELNTGVTLPANTVKEIVIDPNYNVMAPQDSSKLFSQFGSYVTSITGKLDTSNVTNMAQMFESMTLLSTLQLDGFVTDNVTNMNYMFSSANSLTTLDGLNISNWNTSNVTDMSYMFYVLGNIITLNLNNWDTSNVTNMASMFRGTNGYGTSIQTLYIDQWNVSKVTDMSNMFNYLNQILELNINNWDTSSVTNMSGMFANTFTGFYIKDHYPSLDLSGWNTSNVTDMSSMFQYAFINSINLSTFDTSKVTNMTDMFKPAIPSSPFIKYLNLGKNTILNDTVNLSAISNDVYNGQWIQVTADNNAYPAPNTYIATYPNVIFDSPNDFMNNYNGQNNEPGWYTWQLDGGVINYLLFGGENNPANPSIYTEDQGVAKFENPTTTLKGVEFIGWFVKNDQGEFEPITEIPKNQTATFTLYAKWYITPDAPTFANNKVTMPTQEGIVYTSNQVGNEITVNATIAPEYQDGFEFKPGVTTEWKFQITNTSKPGSGNSHNGGNNSGNSNNGNPDTQAPNTLNPNTGDSNTGDLNTGDLNSGNLNSGSDNTSGSNQDNYGLPTTGSNLILIALSLASISLITIGATLSLNKQR